MARHAVTLDIIIAKNSCIVKICDVLQSEQYNMTNGWLTASIENYFSPSQTVPKVQVQVYLFIIIIIKLLLLLLLLLQLIT